MGDVVSILGHMPEAVVAPGKHDHLKFTKAQTELLDEFVKFARANGRPHATRITVIQALIADGLVAFKESRQ